MQVLAACRLTHRVGDLSCRNEPRHLVHDIGPETTHSRSIFCTRVRKTTDSSSSGWTRCHLIAKDSQRAPLGIYLTFGTTGLLFWILNHGGKVGRGLRTGQSSAGPADHLARPLVANSGSARRWPLAYGARNSTGLSG